MADVKEWKLYEQGKDYNNNLIGEASYYENIDTNVAFYNGDQWRNSKGKNLPKPVFNIIRKAINYFVSVIATSNIGVSLEQLSMNDIDDGKDGELKLTEIVNAEIDNLLEKFGMEYLQREALTDAAVMGDIASHLYFDMSKKPYRGLNDNIKGEMCLELVDGCNVMFGNANTTDIESQPYIIVIGRAPIKQLQKEKDSIKANTNKDKLEQDNDFNFQAGDNGKIEVSDADNGKALYIIVYERTDKGTIKATKCTQSSYIYQDIDMGYERYPISWLVWEKQKNQYHGRAVATGMIPNQIAINKTFAMHIYNLMRTAFPTLLYDKNKINGFSNEIGAQIGIDKVAGESLGNIATYLQGTNASSQSIELVNQITTFTKECLGINDALLGNINPDNTSAIKVVQKASTAPLENVKSNLYHWIEGIVSGMLEIMSVNYGVRPVVTKVKDATGKEIKKVVMFDFEKLKNIYMTSKIDVGQSSYFSDDAIATELGNMFDRKIINAVQLLERMPSTIPDKQGLIDELKGDIIGQVPEGTSQDPTQVLQTGVTEEEANTMAQYVDALPQEIQAELKALPDSKFESVVKQMMMQDK